MLWENWINQLTWSVIAKQAFNLTSFCFANTLATAQITALPPEVLGKNGSKLISNLYVCLGERVQDQLHNRKPCLILETTRYPRIPNLMKYSKIRDYQLLPREQREGESLEQYHYVLSGFAAAHAISVRWNVGFNGMTF